MTVSPAQAPGLKCCGFAAARPGARLRHCGMSRGASAHICFPGVVLRTALQICALGSSPGPQTRTESGCFVISRFSCDPHRKAVGAARGARRAPSSLPAAAGGGASRCRVPAHPRALQQGQDFVQSVEMFCFTSTRFPRQLFLFHFLLLVLDRILHLQVFLCYSEDPKHDYVKSFPGFSVLFFLWVLLTAVLDVLTFSLNVSFGREVLPVTFPLCAFPGLVQIPPLGPSRPQARITSCVAEGLEDCGSHLRASRGSQPWPASPRPRGLLQPPVAVAIPSVLCAQRSHIPRPLALSNGLAPL